MSQPNAVLSALERGQTVLGTFIMEFRTPGVGALAASAGAEFIFFDLQHTGWSIGDLAPSLWGCAAAGVPAGIRVPAAVPWMIGAALDCGAELIMVPAVESADHARSIVAATRYPPLGERAVTFNVASDSYHPPADPAHELAQRNASVAVFAQIETQQGLDAVEEIAAVDGIDVLWVGDNDLAASLGVAGDFEHPTYLAALERVARAANDAGKTAGFTTGSPDAAARMLALGYRALCCGNDIKVFQNALATGLIAFREHADHYIELN
jgi:2-keto-3-deoxy-L-rhamnonate aldolase RhmA